MNYTFIVRMNMTVDCSMIEFFWTMDAERTKFNKVPKKVLERLPDKAKVGFEVAADYQPTFITQPGTYNLFDGKLSIKVSEKGDVLHYEFTAKFVSKGI